MPATDVLAALIKNEPAGAVKEFQALIRERASRVVADLVTETRANPEVVDPDPTAPVIDPLVERPGPVATDDDENNANIVRNVTAESAHWEAGAVKPSHRGKFTKKAEAAGMSVHAYAEKERHAPGTLGKEARLALTFEKQAKDR